MNGINKKYFHFSLFASDKLFVNSTNCCQLNVSALLSRKGIVPESFLFINEDRAFLKVFLRWLNAVFTVRKKAFSSHPKIKFSFLSNRNTADFTLGGGEKSFSFSINSNSTS